LSTIYLMGGLGNQLFQFAAGYNHSFRYHQALYVDLGYINKYPAHGGYRLDKLLLSDYISDTVESSIYEILRNRILMRFPVLTQLFNNKIFHEHYYGLVTNDVADSICPIMLGYWQDAKLFNEMHAFLKSSIVPRNISNRAYLLHSEITGQSMPSVSIHVRRGDYVNNDTALKTHGACSIEYYFNAIDRIKSKVKNIHFFVFTNDPVWVEENFKKLFFDSRVTFVDGNSQEEDLWLMSQAKHHIIANSSFSWWGAWLAQHKSQIVIAPTPWYDKQPKHSTDPSLPEWIRLPK